MPGGSVVTANIGLAVGRPSLSKSLLSAMCQRWMIANGLPFTARHSTVLVVELNGPNQLCAAGSLAAAARLRPTETVSRRSSSLIDTTRPALPGQTRFVLPSSSLGLPIMRQSFGAVGCIAAAECLGICRWNRVKHGACRNGQSRQTHTTKALHPCHPAAFLGNHDVADVCNLGKVQVSHAKYL